MTKRNGHTAAVLPPAVELSVEEPDTADAEMITMAADTLTGDVRDFVLDRIRHEQDKRPWDQRSEAEQRDTIHRVETMARDLVVRAVELIAAEGRRTIKATLEQVTIKDGIKATVTLSKFDPQRHCLMDAQGASILIVVADADEFTGERAEVQVKPDQAELIGDAGVVHSAADGAADTPFH